MSGFRRHPFRFLWRLLRFLGFLLGAGAHYVFWVWPTGRSRSRGKRAAWMSRWAGVGLRALGGRVEVRGALPAGGVVTSNHLGYVDILVLGSLQPVVFLSKADVERWPLVGSLVKAAGTLFIRRERRSQVAEVMKQFAPVLSGNLPLVMFLEGTSSGGTHVLPFRPSLLEPIVAGQWPVTPCWIGYSLTDGSVENEVAYWHDMTLLPHLLNLLTKDRLTAHVAFGETVRGSATDRKELARRLQTAVCELAGKFDRHVTIGSHWHELPVKPV